MSVLSTSKKAAAPGSGGATSTSAAAAEAWPAISSAVFLAMPSLAITPDLPVVPDPPPGPAWPLIPPSLPADRRLAGDVAGRHAAATGAAPCCCPAYVQPPRPVRRVSPGPVHAAGQGFGRIIASGRAP